MENERLQQIKDLANRDGDAFWRSHLNECLSEIDRLRSMVGGIANHESMKAIIEALPKAHDGNPVVPGMSVWYRMGRLSFDGQEFRVQSVSRHEVRCEWHNSFKVGPVNGSIPVWFFTSEAAARTFDADAAIAAMDAEPKVGG